MNQQLDDIRELHRQREELVETLSEAVMLAEVSLLQASDLLSAFDESVEEWFPAKSEFNRIRGRRIMAYTTIREA